MSIGIVVVNYRTPDLVIQCLGSLADEVTALGDAGVVVVDNASGDGSAESLTAEIANRGWTDWASVLPLAKNYGFAGGNKRGLESLQESRIWDYVLLLNSDTIVHPGALMHCARAMDADRGIGVMSCLVCNADGSIQNVTRKFPTPLRLAICNLGLPWWCPRVFGWADIEDFGWDRRTVKRDVEWIGGAFMFIRGELLRRIGGLDESFFFYGEDIEFCHRIWRAGFRCHYDPAGSIVHLGGASSDPTRVPSKQRDVMAWRARYLLQRKCYGPLAAAFVRWIDLLALRLRMAKARLLGRRSTPHDSALQAALAAKTTDVPAVTAERGCP